MKFYKSIAVFYEILFHIFPLIFMSTTNPLFKKTFWLESCI